MDLKFKTRAQTNPQGKPRVYFSCHKDDFALYFEKIVGEILAASDCAVYYYDGDIELTEDYFLNLERMNLFVVPVTEKYLYQKNNALDVEFKYALDNHIPVLPLMQENGLDEIFGEKCGDIIQNS